jgi:hypothetical protein
MIVAQPYVTGGQIRLTPVQQFNLIRNTPLPPDVTESPNQEANLLADYLATAPNRLVCLLRPVFALRGFEEWAYPTVDPRATKI